MRIARHFTDPGKDAYEGIEFRRTTSEIRNPDGSVVFKAEDIEIPAAWSQVASDILAQKYFRKRGLPQDPEEGRGERRAVVAVAQCSRRGGAGQAAGGGAHHRRDHAPSRSSTAWPAPGPTGAGRAATSTTEEDARAFFDEMRYMLARQMAAPNSPQWFNTGLHWAYGIDGPAQGHYYVDFKTGKLTRSASAYEHPQPHACFIQSVADDLVNERGIMDLWVREARLFKYGSGTGTNFSASAARASRCRAAAARPA